MNGRETIDFTDRALPGATDFGDGVVTFALYAPGKQSVHLQGDFNGWDWRRDPMRNRGGGFFVTQKSLPDGRHEYQYVVDEGIVVADPYAQEVKCDPSHDTPNAVIQAGRPIYRWRHAIWQRPRLEDLIIYELHVGDFTPEGTYRGVIDRLDYLRDLGINAIQFLPLCESSSHWGYEPTYPFAPRAAFGPVEDLFRLVDEAHARGIGVILDLVLAHTAREHPFMKLYPYAQSPWYGAGIGQPNQFGLPTLDFTKDAAHDLARNLQEVWMRDFRFDGFRYDYLSGIGGDLQGRGLPALMKDARAIHPEAYLIGECVPENPDLVNGSGLGAVWHTRARLLISTLLGEQDIEPYRAWDFQRNIQELKPETQGYRDVSFMINYAESHDDERLAALLRKRGFDEDTVYLKLALAITLLMTLPGEAMLFQGQEWGEDSAKSTGPNPLDWGKAGLPRARALADHCRRMCRLRRERPSLRRHEFRILALQPDKRLAAYHRRYGEVDQVVVAVNFSGQRQTLTVPISRPGMWHDAFSREILDLPPAYAVDLEPYAARIFCSGVS